MVTGPLHRRARRRIQLAHTLLGLLLAVGGVVMSSRSAAASVTVASDTFARTVGSGGWGSADTGGAWTVDGGCGCAWSVTPGSGLAAEGANDSGGQSISLHNVSVRDLDITVTATIQLPTAGQCAYVGVLARAGGGGGQYRGFLGDCNGSNLNSTTDCQTTSSTIAASNGLVVHYHYQATGAYPTTIRSRIWTTGAEPGTWLTSCTDSTAALQVAGTVGMTFYNYDTSPVTQAINSYVVTSPSGPNTGTATETLSSGGYSVLGQGTIAFPATTLNGTDQTLSQTSGGTPYLDISDATASFLGWNVTAQVSTLFNNTTTPIHSVTDGVTIAGTTVTSATAGFTAADVGMYITASTIPANATINSVTNSTTVVISTAATAGSGLTLKVLSTLTNALVSMASRTALTCDTSPASTCVVGTDGGAVSYPVVILATPTKIIDAAVGTGAGNEGANNNQTWTLGGTIKANQVRAGAYTATITYTMSGGI